MNQADLSYFCDLMDAAFARLTADKEDLRFSKADGPLEIGGRKFSTVIGVVGYYKGRMQIEMDKNLACKLYETMNGEPVDEEMDLCYYLAEFTNILTGNGITDWNNAFKGISLRLTPPAVFVGDNLDLLTPEVSTASMGYQSDYGRMKIEIGFI